MPGDPTGGRLRLKAFCPAGKPRSPHAHSGLRLRAPPLYAYCGWYSSPPALGRLRRPGEARLAARLQTGKPSWTAVGREASRRDER